jgi:hypothetical protein
MRFKCITGFRPSEARNATSSIKRQTNADARVASKERERVIQPTLQKVPAGTEKYWRLPNWEAVVRFANATKTGSVKITPLMLKRE